MPRRKNIGERSRFNGFALGESERDRVIAHWINNQPNAAESIKVLIYAEATGRNRVMIQSPPYGAEDREPQLDAGDPRVQALAALDT
ncbi:MAG: hypothetical protein R3E39_26420 [Anaerolineae bacterium]